MSYIATEVRVILSDASSHMLTVYNGDKCAALLGRLVHLVKTFPHLVYAPFVETRDPVLGNLRQITTVLKPFRAGINSLAALERVSRAEGILRPIVEAFARLVDADVELLPTRLSTDWELYKAVAPAAGETVLYDHIEIGKMSRGGVGMSVPVHRHRDTKIPAQREVIVIDE